MTTLVGWPSEIQLLTQPETPARLVDGEEILLPGCELNGVRKGVSAHAMPPTRLLMPGMREVRD